MIKRLPTVGKIILLLMMILLTTVKSAAITQSPENQKILLTTVSNYQNWERAGWSGKLSLPGLPFSATLRTYMEKGSLTMLSARAPFVGEVARVEVDRDSILIVNCMSKVYFRQALKNLNHLSYDFMDDLQALLLGRVFVAGSGQLSEANMGSVEVFPAGDDGRNMLLPPVPSFISGILYGFTLDADSRIVSAVVAYGRVESVEVEEEEYEEDDDGEMTVSESEEDESGFIPKLQLLAEISYNKKNTANVVLGVMRAGRNPSQYTMTIDPVDLNPKPIARIKDLSGYKPVGLHRILTLPNF